MFEQFLVENKEVLILGALLLASKVAKATKPTWDDKLVNIIRIIFRAKNK